MERWLLAVALAAALSGCKKEEDDAAAAEGLLGEACEHMKGGSVSATATVDGTPSNLSEGHQRHEVTLVAAEDEFVGKVGFSADTAGEYQIFLSKDVTLKVLDFGGREVAALETEDSPEACPEIATILHFDFAVDTYTLDFGPTSEEKVGVIIEAAPAADGADAHTHEEGEGEHDH